MIRSHDLTSDVLIWRCIKIRIEIWPASPAIIVHKLSLAVASIEDVRPTAADSDELVLEVDHVCPFMRMLRERQLRLSLSRLPSEATLVLLFITVEAESDRFFVLSA